MSGVDGSESEPVAAAAVVALASQGVVEAAPADAGSLEAQSASTAMVALAQASVEQPATAVGSEALALATSVAPVAACAPAPTTTPATGTVTPNANAAAKAVANGAAKAAAKAGAKAAAKAVAKAEAKAAAKAAAKATAKAAGKAAAKAKAAVTATAKAAAPAGAACKPPVLEPAVLQSPEISLNPKCAKRKRPVDALKAQLTGKSNGSWKCASCNVKCMQLSRVFGHWPPRSFSALPADWQTKFYQGLDGKGGGAELEKYVIETMTRSRLEQEESEIGGEYLPLSVWHARGFDASRIERGCKDVQEHEVLGKCYRVSIKSVYSKTVEQMVRKELFGGKRPHEASGALAPLAVHEKKDVKKDKKKRCRSESSSSSSGNASSSSSSAKKKKSKGKKNKSTAKGPKDKKDAKGKDAKSTKSKDDKEKDKEKEKAIKASMRLAQRTVAKTASILMTLRQHLADPRLKNAPSFVVDPGKKSLQVLEKYHTKAAERIKSRGEKLLDLTVEQLDMGTKSAVERSALLSKLLDAARKFAA